MVVSSSSKRALAMGGIAISAMGTGVLVGAVTNAINGAVSPHYFRSVMGWHFVIDDIWTASVAQGMLEGVLFGAGFATVFTLVLGVASKGEATLRFAGKYLLMAGVIALATWCIGGLLAMGFAAFSPEFYQNAFMGVPREFGEMLRFAWVGGSIWGIYFGAVLGVVIVSIIASVDWRRQSRAEK